MDRDTAGASQDIRLMFNRVPATYDRVRPSYPPSLFDALFAALPDAPEIVEVGPGTGQATVDLLAGGARVTAVEIGPALASFLAEKFGGIQHLSVHNASFEDVDLPAHRFDAVVCATMYHWISPADQVERPLELLKAGGALGIIDLIQVDSESDHGYFERATPIYEAFGEARRDLPKTYTTARPKIADQLVESKRYASVEVHREPWDQTYTSLQYRDLLMTYSGTQMMRAPERDEMVNQLVGLIDDEFDGVVTRPLVATLTLAHSR